ncbi:hypothetical protein J3U08_00835 [Gilliamella sp. B2894]|uniref:hypothetical protein n=1 Tax=unclassified Gilliamella TaxID=2685620 RepID=UPI00226AAAC0|nr:MULTISPECIES: hypothetical protein [unclassified Gilliamella]MCX8655338.1 hypothetical protein [Gilliamella sp. B2894]MCX8693487.1 hypothetical protein [Gilliamella sp. B2881]MCX8695940.1 hypothetical protein [Gilliamella sp. B2828]
MKSNLSIISLLVITHCFNAIAELNFNRDPFVKPTQISCNEQKEILLKQIQAWRFKGFIKQKSHYYPQIWLYSENHWLAINHEVPSHVLFPWFVQSWQNHKIVWQANLTDYCNETIEWMMSLNES